MIKKLLVHFLDDTGSVDIERMKGKVDKYEVISFDIFDTLIKRSVAKPTDVFKVIEDKTGIEGFALDRMTGEKRARDKTASGEVTLAEIYSNMENVSSNLRPEIMELECKTEAEVCFVNEKVVPLYEYCKKRKRIVIASDMYLPHDVIEKLLHQNNISGYEKIYLSNELNLSKRQGEMYDFIKSDIGKSKIVHIGNSFKADYLNAVLRGLGAIKIPTNL